MREKWKQLIAEHLNRDSGHPDRLSYLMKEKQSVTVLAGDREVEVTHGEGYVFDILEDALALRNLGGRQSHQIEWDEINEMSFAYAYAPAHVTLPPGVDKGAPPPFAYPL